MDDTIALHPDQECLFATASGQRGYFTSGQAGACGYSKALLSSHTGTGRFRRMRRGLYRLRDYPTSPDEDIVAAWLALGNDVAVVSHETALDLFDLGDIIPDSIHVTVPRSKRYLPVLPGVTVHTTTRSLGPSDVVVRQGIPTTAPMRTILDVAERGAAPEQIELAIRQAIARGLVVADRLTDAARERHKRVDDLVRAARNTIAHGVKR